MFREFLFSLQTDDSIFNSTEDEQLRARYEEAKRKGLVTDSLLETSSDDWSAQNRSNNRANSPHGKQKQSSADTISQIKRSNRLEIISKLAALEQAEADAAVIGGLTNEKNGVLSSANESPEEINSDRASWVTQEPLVERGR